jgi:hypothetical protein
VSPTRPPRLPARPCCRVRKALATQLPRFQEGQQQRREFKVLQLPNLQHLHPAWSGCCTQPFLRSGR